MWDPQTTIERYNDTCSPQVLTIYNLNKNIFFIENYHHLGKSHDLKRILHDNVGFLLSFHKEMPQRIM